MSVRRENDAYYTLEQLARLCPVSHLLSGVLLEPCVGDGVMVRNVVSPSCNSPVTWLTNDIDPAVMAGSHLDASDPMFWRCFSSPVDWVVTNPPFKSAFDILCHSWTLARVGVAFLVRLTFLEPTLKRGSWFRAHQHRLSHMTIFGSPRPSFTCDGKTDTATVCWLVWQKDFVGVPEINFCTDWF